LAPYFNFYGLIYTPAQDSTYYCQHTYRDYAACINPQFLVIHFGNLVSFLNRQTIWNMKYEKTLRKAVLWVLRDSLVKKNNTVDLALSDDRLWALTPPYFARIISRASQARGACMLASYTLFCGLLCSFTSINDFEYQVIDDSLTPILIAANAAEVGPSLSACLPLVDFYCFVSFGISIFYPPIGLGDSFDFSDGSLSRQFCEGFSEKVGCSAYALEADVSSDLCTAEVHQTLADRVFSTNYLKFNPTADFTKLLINFLDGKITYAQFNSTRSNLTAYSMSNSFGLGTYFAGQGTGENLTQFGKTSGGGTPIFFTTPGTVSLNFSATLGLILCLMPIF
jgi:hypothetical protein